MVPWAYSNLSPNGISIDSAVFAQLIHVPNAQTTLLATSLAIGRICVQATRPKRETCTWEECQNYQMASLWMTPNDSDQPPQASGRIG